MSTHRLGKYACGRCGSRQTHRCRRVRDAVCVHCDACGHAGPYHPRRAELARALAGIALAAGLAACGADPTPTAAPAVTGAWRVSWSCVDGCDTGRADPILATTELEITAGAARYRADHDGIERYHAGSMLADGFLADDGADFGVTRSSYVLWIDDAGALVGEVTFVGWPNPGDSHTLAVRGER